jgi:hypothetical protein
MTNAQQRQEVFDHWNSKGIVVHKRMTHDIELEIGRTLKYYSLEEVKASIDLYATILEPNLSREQKEMGEGDYWWSYRWGLRDYLKRGISKFDGQTSDNYKRNHRIATPEAIVIKRKGV